MTTRTHLFAVLAVGLLACRGRDARREVPPSHDVAARPALSHASQTDLAKELDDAERHGTWGEVRHRWQGQHLRWTVTRQKLLCQSEQACNVAPFPIQRPATHGWLPALAFAPGEFAKLQAACGAAAQCELTFEGTLGELAASAEQPTSLRFADVHVVVAKAG